MAEHASSRHDSAYFRRQPVRAGPLYPAGAREVLEYWFEGRPIRNEYLVVDAGKLAGVGAHSYSEGNTTGGSEEAAKFKV